MVVAHQEAYAAAHPPAPIKEAPPVEEPAPTRAKGKGVSPEDAAPKTRRGGRALSPPTREPLAYIKGGKVETLPPEIVKLASADYPVNYTDGKLAFWDGNTKTTIIMPIDTEYKPAPRIEVTLGGSKPLIDIHYKGADFKDARIETQLLPGGKEPVPVIVVPDGKAGGGDLILHSVDGKLEPVPGSDIAPPLVANAT